LNFLTAEVAIEIEKGQIKAQLNDIKQHFSKTATSITARAKKMSVMAGAAFSKMASFAKSAFNKIKQYAKWAVVALLGVGTASIKMAMDAQESENLFEVTMGGMAASTRKWSEELSKALYMNAFEVRKSVSVFNAMFTSMGFGAEGAADMSKGLTELAYDIASFYNLKPEEAFIKLQAGVTGEAEALKRLGIIVNETNIKQYALNAGIWDGVGVMTEAEKVTARYGSIMKQTEQAQGDMARTLGSATNVFRSIWSLVKELAIEFGMKLLPAVTDVGIAVRNWLVNNKVAILDWAQTFIDATGRVIADLKTFISFMKNDWVGGIKIAFERVKIETEFLIKFLSNTFYYGGKLVATAFIKTFGSELGKFIAELGSPKGVLGWISTISPAIAAGRINLMQSGTALAKAAADMEISLAASASTFKNAITDIVAGRRKQIEALQGLQGGQLPTPPEPKPFSSFYNLSDPLDFTGMDFPSELGPLGFSVSEFPQKLVQDQKKEIMEVNKQIADNYRSMQGQMGKMTEFVYTREKQILEDLKVDYLQKGMDRITVETWVNEQLHNLDTERLASSKHFFDGVKAAGMKMKDEMMTWGEIASDTAFTMRDAFASGMTSMILEAKKGSEAINEFLRGIGKELVNLLVKQAATGLFANVLGGAAKTATAAPATVPSAPFVPDFSAASAYGGGTVGNMPKSRQISPLAFAGAPSFKNGGLVGLRTGEVPIIAHRGEEVVQAGKTIPVVVELKNTLINKTGIPLEQRRVQTSPEEIVTEIIMKDIKAGGPITQGFQRL